MISKQQFSFCVLLGVKHDNFNNKPKSVYLKVLIKFSLTSTLLYFSTLVKLYILLSTLIISN